VQVRGPFRFAGKTIADGVTAHVEAKIPDLIAELIARA
jgi:hypothetical protein